MCHESMLGVGRDSTFYSHDKTKVVGAGHGHHSSLNRIYYFYTQIEWKAER